MNSDASGSPQYANIVDFSRSAEFYQSSIAKLAKMLPDSDDDLIKLLEEQIALLEAEVFSNLWVASHWVKRRVPGRILAEGSQLLASADLIPPTAILCAERENIEDENRGETCHALIEAVESGRLSNERETTALVAAVHCWELAMDEDEPIPERIYFLTRKLARDYMEFGVNQLHETVMRMMLNVLSFQLQDENLFRTLSEKGIQYSASDAQTILNRLLEEKLTKIVPDRKPPKVISGYQVRRSVPKLGRNEPCHCGSKKKYKRCCFAEDQEKLSRSSEVPGKTIDDLEAEGSKFLTPRDVSGMRAYEVLRLDPEKLDLDLIRPVADRLALFDELDHIFVLWEKSPYHDDPVWELVFEDLIYQTIKQKRFDLMDRIIDSFPHFEESCPMNLSFHRARETPEEFLNLLEERCREILCMESDEESSDTTYTKFGTQGHKAPSTVEWTELAHTLLDSEYPHLGIVFARFPLLVTSVYNIETLLESVESLRDNLGMPPFDIADDIAQVNEDFDRDIDHSAGTEMSDSLVNHVEELERKKRDLERLKESLTKSQKEARKAENMAEAKLAEFKALQKQEKDKTQESVLPENDAEIKRLRARLNDLKSEVKTKHEQRNTLRRELRAARTELVERQNADSNKKTPKDDFDEESWLGEEATDESKTVRIPEFPDRFLEANQTFPGHIVSAAVQLAGRLAAGDESAFQGTRRLKSKREYLRQKVGGSHRLIFKIEGDRLQVIDLINRRDLEKWLKS